MASGGEGMSVKTIFQEGMKERKRKKSLGRMQGDLREKEKAQAGLLAALGQKAWETQAGVSGFAELKATLGEAQKALADLKAESEQLQKRKQESEAARKRENDRLGAAIKEADEKKRGTEKRIDEQKNILQANQKESQRAGSRLTAIAGERARLEGRRADPAATEAEKQEAARGLDLLAKEEEGLKTGIGCRQETDKPVQELVRSLQQETEQLQKQVNSLKDEQKKKLAEIDKAIATLNNELAKNQNKAKETENRQKLDFQRLGEKLADGGGEQPELAAEMAGVKNMRGAMDEVRAQINGLEDQKDDAQVGAYKKMMAMLIAAGVLIAAAVILLILLLAPKKQAGPLAAVFQGEEKAAAGVADWAKTMQEGLGGIKDKSEEIQGHAIEAASEKTMRSALPDVSGWRLNEPEYNRSTFQEIETSSLQAGYEAPDGDSVHVEITDAGTASALLLPLRMAFATNLSVDDEHVSQKVTTIKDTPVLERYDKDNRESTIGIIFKDRYLVELRTESGQGLELLRKFASRLDLARLP
jgi:hypothetical protein